MVDSGNIKKSCKYGSDCYRKNPVHFEEFSHPSKRPSDQSCDIDPAGKRSKIDLESVRFPFYRLSYVYNLPDETGNQDAVKISSLLSSHEALQESAQFNYMIDVRWLHSQYPESCRSKPLLIVHGLTGSDRSSLHEECSSFRNISLSQASLPMPFGTHHTKMMLLRFRDGLVVVVHTANLVPNDWHQKTQGVWASPLLPVKGSQEGNQRESICASSSTFQSDLIEYLTAYRLNSLNPWIETVKRHDFSDVRARLVASVPGRHVGDSMHKWGHLKLRQLIGQHAYRTNLPSSVVAQFSSIGSLGPSADKWLTAEFMASLSKGNEKNASLSLVFPSVDDVRCSLEGYMGGGCLPYSSSVAQKQPWLNSFLHRWKSESKARTRACPHIKTYAALSKDSANQTRGLDWFLLTSSNLSKAAWGGFEKKESQLMIRSYELGVLFLSEDFPDLTEEVLPYDYPLQKYCPSDKPWVVDCNYEELADSHGNVWCPR